MRVSVDGETFFPMTPKGKKNFKFPCARKAGYEQVEFTLPKSILGNAVVQMEFDHEFGTTVQCADIIVQAKVAAKAKQCFPACQNGGVCISSGDDEEEGVCRCAKNFTGDHCEDRVDASGSFSFLMFLVMIALVAAGIGLLLQRRAIQEEIKKLNQGGAQRNKQYDAVPQNNYDEYGNEVFDNRDFGNPGFDD